MTIRTRVGKWIMSKASARRDADRDYAANLAQMMHARIAEPGPETFPDSQLTISILKEAFRGDPVFVTAMRHGLDERTTGYLKQELSKPELEPLRHRIGERVSTEGFVQGIRLLLEPWAVPERLDIPWLMKHIGSLDGRDAALTRAMLGLAALAVVEGLARKYRPSEFPWFSLGTMRLVSLPVAGWLKETDAFRAASCLERICVALNQEC